MRRLWEVADFVRSIRRQMRFGEISRSPLRLLRVELHNDTLECDWIARPPGVWDCSLRRPGSPYAISCLMRFPKLIALCRGPFVSPRASLPR